ncbi:MAG: MBL fold metallo-hydrolase [Bacillota bacterium]|nr:MBL fold metallo-hydrolase [Bacillota bacterium]
MVYKDDSGPLHFIGTGSAFNTALGNNSAYIKRSSTLILFDCGGTVFHRLQQLTLLENIKSIYVIITHTHPDHIGSLGDLIFYTYYMLNSKTTVIYPDPSYIRSLLNYMGVTDDFYEIRNIGGDTSILTADITLKLQPVSQKHADTLECTGYIGSFDNCSLFYSGDSQEISEQILVRFKSGEIQYLYQDTCGKDFPQNPHMYIGKLAQCIVPELRQRVYCMHQDKSFDPQAARNLGFKVAQPESF